MTSSLAVAVQAWIIAIFGWVWLSVLELGGVSLLAAQAFLGMLWLSTCNLVLTALLPESRAPPAGYFGAVLAFVLHLFFCVLDTFESSSTMSTSNFVPPWNGTNCTLARMHQVFYFSGSQFYLVHAGSAMGYLVVQLLVAASHMLDSERRSSVWPGPAWGVGLVALLAFRGFVMFDGSAQGRVEMTDKTFFYFKLFSEPVLVLTLAFSGAFLLSLLLMSVDGLYLKDLPQRKFVRFFSFGFSLLFFFGACVVFGTRGVLTIPLFFALCFTLPPALVGVIEASKARNVPVSAPVVAHPQQPTAKISARSVFNRVAPPGGRHIKHLIPVPVEMRSVSEKNKAV